MTGTQTVVYLHGVGGPDNLDQWLDPLNLRLGELGRPTVQPGHDNVVAPEYLAQMRLRANKELPPTTWTRPAERVHLSAQLQYASACEKLAAALAGAPKGSLSTLSDLPEGVVQGAADFASDHWPDVRDYKRSEVARASALHAVLRWIPKNGHMILIGYSLGSVVAHDLLLRLPKGTTVDLLVTLGSPLAINGFGEARLKESFPYDRVRAWVNLYDASDVVTVGRGAGARFPDALDYQVGCKTHDVSGYASHPAFGLVIAATAFPTAPSTGKEVATRTSLAKDFGAAWYPTLLQHAYCASVSSTYPQDAWKSKLRLDEARKISAERALAQVQQALASAAVDDQQRSALRGHPTPDDLLVHSHRHIQAQRPLQELIPFLIALSSTSPATPFDVDISDEHRRRALERLCGSARRREGDEPADSEVAKAVIAAIGEGSAVVRPSSSGGVGGGWLVLLGLGLLAATGVGLLAAIPAGLAGAAAMTATLAAFGPGGMVGGMVTLAALTGAGTAFLGGGLALPATGAPKVDRSLVITTAAESLAHQPVDALPSTVAALLSVLEAQRLLSLKVSYSEVMALLSRTSDLVRAEKMLHDRVAPDRPGTKNWADRVRVITKAIDWMLARDWPEGTRPAPLEP